MANDLPLKSVIELKQNISVGQEVKRGFFFPSHIYHQCVELRPQKKNIKKASVTPTGAPDVML